MKGNGSILDLNPTCHAETLDARPRSWLSLTFQSEIGLDLNSVWLYRVDDDVRSSGARIWTHGCSMSEGNGRSMRAFIFQEVQIMALRLWLKSPLSCSLFSRVKRLYYPAKSVSEISNFRTTLKTYCKLHRQAPLSMKSLPILSILLPILKLHSCPNMVNYRDNYIKSHKFMVRMSLQN